MASAVSPLQESRLIKGSHHTKKSKEEMSKNKKGKHFSRKTEFKKGQTYEQKFGRKKAEEIRKKHSENFKGKNNPFYEKHHTEGQKQKWSKNREGQHNSPNSEFQKGQTPWNEGLTGQEYKEHFKNGFKGIFKVGQNPWNKGVSPSLEVVRKMLTRRIPSSLEEKFQKIINKYDLPYKYVGNGRFFVENLNPDFINTNSKKIAIEVYAKHWKEVNGGIKKYKKYRDKIFAEYGWQIIYFDETQVNEDNVLKCLK